MTETKTIPIQKLRVQRGWSQEQLAELSGLSPRTIQRLERGQKASVESLKCLAAVFEVDFTDLKESPMQPAPSSISPDEALAFARVRKIKGFYVHLANYCVVVTILAVINLLTTPSHLWVGYTALAWGSGVLIHGLLVFQKVPFLNGDWEKRHVEKYLGRKL